MTSAAPTDRDTGGSGPKRPAPTHVPARALLAVVIRPRLWRTALRQMRVMAEPGWWHRRPFLPLPAPDYLRFRLQTAYGGDGTTPIEPDDLVGYLRWCRDSA